MCAVSVAPRRAKIFPPGAFAICVVLTALAFAASGSAIGKPWPRSRRAPACTGQAHEADPKDLVRRLLRARHERPGRSRTAEQRDDLAPFPLMRFPLMRIMGTHQPRPESKVHGRTGSVSRLWEGTLIGAVEAAAAFPKQWTTVPRAQFSPQRTRRCPHALGFRCDARRPATRLCPI